jgi:ribosomal peptide maturation radical SAM protein 1
MPFASIERPSLGVSLLKSGVKRIGMSAKIHYFNIKFAERIDLKLFHNIAEGSLSHLSLIGELIFAGHAFNRSSSDKEIFEDLSRHLVTLGYSHSFSKETIEQIVRVIESVPDFIEECASEVLKDKPQLVAFSSTFYQNCASISLCKAIKHHAPIPIIIGGANCEGEMGATLIRTIPWIDFVCSGEGDLSFVEFLKLSLEERNTCKINGIITRNSNALDIALTNPVMNMDDLPIPNFDDYFYALEQSSIRNSLSPTLVLETSRGCWWGEKFQCTFCGLNGSTMKYRSKSISRALHEIEELKHRYGIKRFNVVDNILDMKYIETLFPELYDRGTGAEFFYDTKSNLSNKQLSIMRRGGLYALQPGIESLSDDILKLMKKGVTVLQNIQLLKWCRELGIIPYWNIIWGFPGERKEEYDLMARIVPLLVHLHPPNVFIKVSLDRFSPYFINPAEYGMKNIRPGIAYKFVYPFSESDRRKIAYHFDFDYSDGRDPSSYVEGLRQVIDEWWTLWENKNIPSLNVMRINDTTMINDSRPCSINRFQILSTEEDKVYAICESLHSFNAICVKMQEMDRSLNENDIKSILDDLIAKRLMLCDNHDKYLSIAVRVKNSNRS